MRSLAELIFELGYLPKIQDPVKDSFLTWYYEASKSDKVVRGLEADNPELSGLAIQAYQEAQNFDRTNEVVQLTETIGDLEKTIKIYAMYLAVGALVFSGGLTAAGIFHLTNSLFSTLAKITGSLVGLSTAGLIAIYRVLIHQIRTNSELVKKFNQELAEKPGDVRSNDQDWHYLAAQVFWNRSLLSTRTHNCLILLSVIRTISPSLFGYVSADLQEDIQSFAEMSSTEILRHQARKAADEIIPDWRR
jgi:uncharacterized membrane protein YkgB